MNEHSATRQASVACVIHNPEADHNGMPCWTCWREVLAERDELRAALEKLEVVARAAERYLAATNMLAFQPSKDVETAAAHAHVDLTEALSGLD